MQCRRAKLKCDRNLPCASCVKRGDAVICSYPHIPGASVKHDANTKSGRQVVAEDRILHLESLVKKLMDNQPSEQTSTAGATFKPVTPPAMSTDMVPEAQDEPLGASTYVGSTHWSAILDDIQELKAVLGSASSGLETIEKPITSRGPPDSHREVLFGSADYSLEEILAQHLPPKIEVDRLLSIYFQGESFIIPFVHTYHFQRQYREFWADTAAVNPLWGSTLFSICCIANLIKAGQSQAPLDSPLTAAILDLHTAAAKCLVLGEYYRPQAQAVEAFALYAQCKNLWSLDPSREAGAILGMVVRMAYEMGYHRDPDSYGSFTVFEGEMRRRFWSSCKQVDLMISFQLGLPSNIRLENTDTKSPRNLLDSDFDEDTQILPPSRSESEVTRILWFIVKDRQMPGFSRVCQDALSFKEKTEEEVLQLNNDIQRMYDTIPDSLRTRPLSESIMDQPFIIMTRLYVEYIYLKSLLVLHRRYMVKGLVSSTHSCVNAGKRLVSQFIEMFREFADGGQLFTERWMLTNFTMNDFLLGSMVLCLAVHTRRKSLSRGSDSVIDFATEVEILALLEQAYAICVEKSNASKDARRVARAIRIVLDGARASSTFSCGMDSTLVPETQATHTGEEPDDGVDLTVLSLQSGSEQNYLRELPDASFETLDPFSFMGDDFDSFNWMAFEP